MSRIVTALKQLAIRKPLLANCIAYGGLYSGAEFTQQLLMKKALAEKSEPCDLGLVGRYAVLGSTIYPVGLYYWYNWLDRAIIGTAARTLAFKVVLDQIVTMPPMIYVFYIGMSLMEGRKDIYGEFKEKFWTTFWTSCAFWMPVQYINFFLMPTSLRVVFVATTSFLWVNILCILKRNENQPQIVATN